LRSRRVAQEALEPGLGAQPAEQLLAFAAGEAVAVLDGGLEVGDQLARTAASRVAAVPTVVPGVAFGAEAGLDHTPLVVQLGSVGLVDLEVGGGGVEEEQVNFQVEGGR